MFLPQSVAEKKSTRPFARSGAAGRCRLFDFKKSTQKILIYQGFANFGFKFVDFSKIKNLQSFRWYDWIFFNL